MFPLEVWCLLIHPTQMNILPQISAGLGPSHHSLQRLSQQGLSGLPIWVAFLHFTLCYIISLALLLFFFFNHYQFIIKDVRRDTPWPLLLLMIWRYVIQLLVYTLSPPLEWTSLEQGLGATAVAPAPRIMPVTWSVVLSCLLSVWVTLLCRDHSMEFLPIRILIHTCIHHFSRIFRDLQTPLGPWVKNPFQGCPRERCAVSGMWGIIPSRS